MKALRAGPLKGVQINRIRTITDQTDNMIPDSELGSLLQVPDMNDPNDEPEQELDEDMAQLDYFPQVQMVPAEHPAEPLFHWSTGFVLDPALEPNYHVLGGSDDPVASSAPNYSASGSDYVLSLPPPPPDQPTETSGPSRARRRKREPEVDPANEVEGKRSRTASRRARAQIMGLNPIPLDWGSPSPILLVYTQATMRFAPGMKMLAPRSAEKLPMWKGRGFSDLKFFISQSTLRTTFCSSERERACRLNLQSIKPKGPLELEFTDDAAELGKEEAEEIGNIQPFRKLKEDVLGKFGDAQRHDARTQVACYDVTILNTTYSTYINEGRAKPVHEMAQIELTGMWIQFLSGKDDPFQDRDASRPTSSGVLLTVSENLCWLNSIWEQLRKAAPPSSPPARAASYIFLPYSLTLVRVAPDVCEVEENGDGEVGGVGHGRVRAGGRCWAFGVWPEGGAGACDDGKRKNERKEGRGQFGEGRKGQKGNREGMGEGRQGWGRIRQRKKNEVQARAEWEGGLYGERVRRGREGKKDEKMKRESKGRGGRQNTGEYVCPRVLEQAKTEEKKYGSFLGWQESKIRQTTYHQISPNLPPGRRPHRRDVVGIVGRIGRRGGRGREGRQVDPLQPWSLED
ncbi:hypothetical protein B0H13DRAFT_2492545 [Mycena leptocephala]|nr:hypothetical protein B0H13DRAFT_2492545 [Mycena leptocephala]